MTTKEKDYVNYMLTKSLKQNRSDINYKHLFTESDVKLEYVPPTTETKTSFVFGKDTCRDNKRNRYFLNSLSISKDLMVRREIENMIIKLSFMKYYVSEDCREDIIKNIDENISVYIRYPKIWRLLDEVFDSMNEEIKKSVFFKVIELFEYSAGFDECKDFVIKWYDKIPVFKQNEIDNHFLTHYMTNGTGLTLATCLLINNEDLYDVFYTNLIIRIDLSLEVNEVWNFLAVLMKYCNKDKKFRLVKLTKSKLFEIQNDEEKLKHARNYAKCLGFELEDLF